MSNTGLTIEQISIHALREEGDKASIFTALIVLLFLSTPSARRATPHQRGCGQHPPISIHALREEGDLLWGDTVHRPTQFLSTPSARRATR